MKKETFKNVELTILTDEMDSMALNQLTEGMGMRKNGDRQFVFTKAPRQRVPQRKNPRIYSGSVVHTTLRKDGRYGISAYISTAEDLSLLHKVARAELDEVFDKLGALA